MENDSNLQLAVVEEKISSIERLTTKLDTAIEKISEVNNNVSRMLAVHEEKIAKQEQVDNILFDKIDKLRDKMDSDHDSVTQRIRGLERKVWIGLGILSTVTFLLNLPFNPQKVLQSQQPSVMMDLR
jgi:predicted  nucleic acid-binding Zn-ribbon protein